MKNHLLYSLIIFISGIFVFSGIKEKKFSNSITQNIKLRNNNKSDSSINKLPFGYQFISNFKLKKNKKTIAISQDSSGVMLFLNRKSVVFFDGKIETELYIENIPNTFKKDKELNQFYVANKEGFGLLKKDLFGNYIYKTLSDINTIDNFTKIIVSKKKVWFISEHKIVSVNPHRNNENKIEFYSKENVISGAFFFNNKLFFSQNGIGLQLLQNDTTSLIIEDSLFSNSKIIFSVKFQNKVILGMGNNLLYSFSGLSYTPIKIKSEDYIKESIITDGIKYDDTNFVVLTLNGGAIIINKESGETIHTINYRTGLPDDEIYTGKICGSGGLWLSHDYGISRIAFDIPVTNYGYYPGLQGKVNSVKVFDSTLYVATGEGLYKLSEIKNFEEVEVATKKRVKRRVRSKIQEINNNSRKSNYTDTENLISDDELDVENSGFFSRWKKRRKKKKEEKGIQKNEDNIAKDKKNKPNSRTNKWSYKTVYKDVVEYQKIYELQSVKHSYKKIEGINSKCKQLKIFSGGLFASTNSGLFYIVGNNIETILPNAYIYNISGGLKDSVLFTATSEGLFKIIKTNKGIVTEEIIGETIKRQKFNNIYKVNDSIVWCNTLNNIYKLELKGVDVVSSQKFNIGSEQIDKLIVLKENGKVLFFTSNSVFYYDDDKGEIILHKEYNKIYRKSENLYSITERSLILTGNKSLLLNINTQESLGHLKYAWLIDGIDKIYSDDNNIWVLSSDNSIYKISEEESKINTDFKIIIKRIVDNKGKSYSNYSRIQLASDYKNITINLSSPYYLKKDFVKYLYGVDSKQTENFISSVSSSIVIPALNTGEHTIYFQAINDLNERSELLEINVNINPPFWKNLKFIIAFFLVILMILVVGISAFFRRKQRKIKEYNRILEEKVKERTTEIKEQNRLIQNKNTEIESQYQKINHQNEEITGSIRYARRIQKAALPNTNIQEKYISGYFNLFKPRDIVSGDFYWMSEAQNKLFIAAVDCTGHGVPGGFLSMLGISFLNEIVRELNREGREIKAANILNILRSKIIGTLSKQGDNVTRDGMDMSLVIIDRENMKLNYAGANNPAYIIRQDVLTKIDADRMPIGYNHKLNDILFTDKMIDIQKGDLIYLFSDGYPDQFGGKFGKKFNSRRFRELLSHMGKFSMDKQKGIADAILTKWMGENDQIDDILLIGIQI